MFVIQPKFKSFLRSCFGRVDPDSFLGMLSAIIRSWSIGPTLAGEAFTEFIRVRAYLKEAESRYLNVRQSFSDPGLLFGTFDNVFSSTLELILFVVEEECHRFDGLGGEDCPCPRCFASLHFTVRVRKEVFV